jgi:hypothetical protein
VIAEDENSIPVVEPPDFNGSPQTFKHKKTAGLMARAAVISDFLRRILGGDRWT